jgi:hypothetical protein
MESRKSRADNDDIEFFGRGVGRPFRRGRAHMINFL